MSILVFFIFVVFGRCDYLTSKLSTLRKSLCPYVDFQGSSSCGPAENSEPFPFPKMSAIQLVTVDTLTGRSTYPIIDLKKSRNLINTTGLKKWPNALKFDNASEFYHQFYDLNLAIHKDLVYYNGMFRQDSFTNDVLPMLEHLVTADAKRMLVRNQLLYSHYQLTLNSMDDVVLNSEFVEIVEHFLPKTFDEEIYARFVEVFGSHSAMSCHIGGMIQQTVFVENCKKERLFKKTFDKDLQMDIYTFVDKPSNITRNGSADYVKYSAIRRDLIVGGNPLISTIENWKKRIATFRQDPVAIKCNMKPIYEFVSDPTKSANIKKYLTSYVAKETAKRAADIKALRDKQPVPFVLGTPPFHGGGYPDFNPICSQFNYVPIVPGILADGLEKDVVMDYFFGLTSKEDPHHVEDNSGEMHLKCTCLRNRSCACYKDWEVVHWLGRPHHGSPTFPAKMDWRVQVCCTTAPFMKKKALINKDYVVGNYVQGSMNMNETKQQLVGCIIDKWCYFYASQFNADPSSWVSHHGRTQLSLHGYAPILMFPGCEEVVHSNIGGEMKYRCVCPVI